MPSDAILLAVIVGACTWGFRYLPLRAGLHAIAPGGPLGRFLAATGPAAIATLFVAAALPYAGTTYQDNIQLLHKVSCKTLK